MYGNTPPAELSAPPQASTPPSTAPASGSSSSSLSGGAIAGIVIAAIAGLGALTFLLILFVRKQRKNKRHKHDPDFADCDKESTIPSSPFKLTMFPTVSPVRIKSASGSDTISPIDSGPLAEEASLQTSNSDTPSLPSLPWHEFIIEPKGLEFLRNPDTGERLILGSGRFGRVYRGILNGTEPVAIKCIDDETVGASAKDLERGLAATVPRQATTPRERVMREIALLKACRSQYIVSFLGVCFQMGEVQLVMELMSGGDLWGRIHHSEWGGWFKGGREIAVDVAMGLSFLHAKRVVHLDLKSSNILLRNSNGGVGGGPSGAKLTDVGLSKILPISREYIASTAGGTWHWCAPEIILGQKCTPAADIWSFGVVVWELCTGEAPLRGQLRAVKVPEECPQEVEELINRCWSTDPEKRPTAVEIVRILNGSNTQALSIRGSDGSIGPSDTDTILSSSPPPAAANSQMKILSRGDNVV